MSHTATCSWDGSHAPKRGFRLDYFRDILLALGREKGQSEVERVLREQGLVPAALSDIEIWLSREQGIAILEAVAGSLGSEAALEGVERWLSDHWAVPDLPEDGFKRLADLGDLLVRTQGMTDSEGRWTVVAAGRRRCRLIYEGPSGPVSALLCAHRRAQLRLLGRTGGIDGLKVRQRVCRSEGGEHSEYDLVLPWRYLGGAELSGALLVVATVAAACVVGGAHFSLPMACALLALLGGSHYLMGAQHRWKARLHENDRRLLLRSGRLSLLRQGYLDRLRRMLADENLSAQAVFNRDGLLEHVTGRFNQQFGVHAEQFKSVEEFERWLGPRPWTGRRTLSGGAGDRVLNLRELELKDADGRTEALLLQVDEPGTARIALKDAEAGAALLEALVLNGQDAVLLLDREGRCFYASDNMERLFGHRPAQLIGHALGDLLDPGDAAALRSVLAGMGDGAGAQLRLRLRHSQRGWRWVQANVLDRRALPALGGYLVEIRDVTDQMESEAALRVSEESLRRNEQFFRMIIESSIDLVLLLDEKRRLLFVNPAVTALLGYRPTEVLGQDILGFVLPGDRKTVEEKFEEARTQVEGWTSVRMHVQHRDGSSRHFEARGRLSKDPEGRPVIVVGARDISRESELVKKALQENRLEAVGRLAGGVAHDFNNLLTVILGHTELALSEAGSDGPLRQRLGQVHEASLRASELVSQLLAFGRKQVLQPAVLDLNEFTRKNLGFIERVLGPQTRLSVQYADEPLMIMAEPISLARAVLNLASNARDAMPDGGAVKLSVFRVEGSAPPEACFSMVDNGVGMSPEVKARIFEPYFTTRGQGNGLGLALVFGTMQQLGGHVDVFSESGQGSRFDLRFPIADAVTTVETAGLPAAPAADQQGGGRTVLVVDDDPNVRRLATEGLRAHGYAVLEACNGEEAIALWREARYHRHPIDLLFSDIVMPRMSGIQLADQIVREEPKQAVLLCSGYFDSESGPAETPIFPVLRKPFTIEHLLQSVNQACRPA